MNDPSTTIEVSVRRSQDVSASIEIGGRGDLIHLIEAFQVVASLMGIRLEDERAPCRSAMGRSLDS